MKKNRIILFSIIVFFLLLIAGVVIWLAICGLPWGFSREVPECEAQLRLQFVSTAEQWIGRNGNDGTHHEIVDLYNAHEPLAQNYQVTYSDKWCATFVSAAAIACDLTQIIPTECGCERQIELFRHLNRWEENDAYIPLPGDIIYYSSSDTGIGDCKAHSDHVGIVVGTFGSYIKVIEGNVLNKVAYRYIPVDAVTIRGYALPDYTSFTNKTPMD